MEKLGIVTSADSKNIEVKIHRDSACGENCAACGLCGNREMTVTLKNTGDFCVGDEVRLFSEDKKFLKSSAIGYLSLTLLLLLGGIVGSLLGNDWLSFVLAIAFLFAGIIALRIIAPKSIEINVEKVTR